MKKDLKEILRHGRSNAIAGHVLAEALDLPDNRALTKLIERARRAGLPVCASVVPPAGYFLASDSSELRAYIGDLQKRETEIGRTREALETILDREEVQP